MPESIPENSVGIVKPQCLRFDEPLELRSGKQIDSYELMIETYGELNAARSNAVLICHALSGDHHAAGYHSEDDSKPGWWDTCIGPGKPIDTNHFFVVSLNNLGGCAGSTGPSSINPATGKFYGPDFPVVTVRDWVKSQARLADRLGIAQWAAVIGGSLGGMQVMRWAISYPQRLRHAVIIAAAPKLSAQNIAFNEVARQSITADPNFHDGRYLEFGTYPKKGVMLARMVGHITYLSDSAMRDKFGKEAETPNSANISGNFGRDLRTGQLSFGLNVDFQVESYLHYQGERFSERFDANTYLLMTKALDYFDPTVDYEGSLSKAFEKSDCRFLLMSFSSDWRFPPERSREIVNALLDAGKQVSYLEIEADQGHDAFLLPVPRYMDALHTYLQRVSDEVNA
ncbi:MAG: homoserine O-acetyltransferase [Pseudomonadales bacterium]|nr:homoserine O-acetyltransferase [Pseudomonadales bacterium]MCP5330339.1 homoserine O-acetyltransferase [Pseudomonadales bacterium]MCP5344048.1 homoserine O-acetyltransferase [Pseudomonadales bacterium]